MATRTTDADDTPNVSNDAAADVTDGTDNNADAATVTADAEADKKSSTTKEILEQRRAETASRAKKRNAAKGKKAKADDGPSGIPDGVKVPQVFVVIASHTGYAYRPIDRRDDGTPIMYSEIIQINPRTAQRERKLVPDPNGTLHRQRRLIQCHGGGSYTLFADEAAGLILNGYADLDPEKDNPLNAEELIEQFLPEALREEAFA